VPRPPAAQVGPERLLTPWTAYLDEVELALAAGDRARAMRAWSDAQTAAFASRRWEPLLDVGDASLRVGDGTGGWMTAPGRRPHPSPPAGRPW
jgi:hypothetical protein